MRDRIIRLLIIVAIGLVADDASGAAAGPSRISSARILVGDIIDGCDGAACAVEVGSAPLPGKSRVVRRAEVRRALEREGIDPKSLRLPKRRRVIRTKRTASQDELATKIRAAVLAVVPLDVVIEELGRAGPLDVPKNGFDVQAHWPGENTFRRRVSVPVSLINDGVTFRTLQISAKLILEMRLPVAARDMEAGTILTPNSVSWATTRLVTPPLHTARTIEEVIGRRLAKQIGHGEQFSKRDLQRIPIVMRGQRLMVESQVGLVSIHASGVARQEGAAGDRIRVVAGPENRLLWAKVIAPGRAVMVP